MEKEGRGVGIGPYRLVWLAGLLIIFNLVGCAGTTTFTPYPSKINPLISNVETGQKIDPAGCLIGECQSKDQILYTMERGRLAQIFGDVEASMRDYSNSIEKIRENDQRAVVSASAVGANIAAVALNDNAIPYREKGYERIMLHHYQAINYLKKGNVEGAGVEVRCANMEQEEALKRHEKEIEKANREAEEKEVGGLLGNPELATRYAQLDEIAGKVKNSFQNAYTFYLSGIIYEILNQPNDAYIDYKKALEIYPDNPYLQKDVLRLARALDMDEDLRAVKEKFALNDTDVAELDPGHGELVLLFEDGFVPQKEQVKIPIPVPRVGLVSIAFPIYEAKWAPPAPLQVNKDDLTMGTTAPICEMRALAVKALKEEAPAIAARQVLRAIAKGATRKEVKDRVGLLGGLAMDAWNFASENADLRSWITLPANAQILRTWLPAGAHKLRLQQEDSAAVGDVEVDIKEGSKTILYVVKAKDQLYSSAVSF